MTVKLREIDTIQGKLLCQNGFYLHSEKGYNLKGNNLLPREENSVLLE